ncbi:DEAD/DEAH box helicase [Salinibacterium sp. ZJ454]|uniref:DEAD/DEAH box helicase n=1 Tax=Salinibacterium sp. ZJ454 TaxID=2708339 RepID=UPI00142007A1|nr:DEAD/DEAH box helicase [Salinibacterium sp. ZJ454]
MPDSTSVNFVLDRNTFADLRRGSGPRGAQEQFILLRMLVEDGVAVELPNGFEIDADDVANLALEESDVLGLPPIYPGEFITELRGNTRSPAFRITLKTRLGQHHEPWKRTGAILVVGADKQFRITGPMLSVLAAVENHAKLSPEGRTEAANVALIAQLQDARQHADPAEPNAAGDAVLNIDLGHLNDWATEAPTSVSLRAEPQRDGSMLVTPDLGIDVDPEALETRWHHIDPAADGGVIRVGKKLVLLDEKRAAGVREVLSNRVIPKHQVKQFLEAPGAFFDASLVDLDMGFSVRVKGVGAIDPTEFAEQTSSGLDWFAANGLAIAAALILQDIKTPEELAEVREKIAEAWERGDDATFIGGECIDVRDREEVTSALEKAEERIARAIDEPVPAEVETPVEKSVKVGLLLDDDVESDERLAALVRDASLRRPVDYGSLKRSPLPHQQEGVEWMTRLMQASLDGDDASPLRIQGAILADDMGLGKTYMTLVALREFLRAQEAAGATERPTLAVLPLSLIENWEEEIDKTFEDSPFRDVVVMQSARDLPRFRVMGARKETLASASSLDESGRLADDAIKFALRVGPEYGPDRLDRPGRLVLTTYDALRDYQLSFAQVDWGVVVFDEAQNVKDPSSIRTRAAKGIKARFKLLATGTPIENSIRDLWCLMDTAQPGYLGTWRQFSDRWLAGEGSDDGLSAEVGGDIRQHIGQFMLRRTKAEHLTGLPPKTIYTGIEVAADEDVEFDPALAEVMPDAQRVAYDDELARYKAKRVKDPGDALKTLQALRSISLHPHLRDDHFGSASGEPDTAARVKAAFRVLDRVRGAGEKVIVFVIDRRMQLRMAMWIQQRYGLLPDVVNGETKAVSTSGAVTRRGLISRFEQTEGFNMIIMSPLAVGVGLTITGANHAIFLERHWNPAKEAQATDRIYRIGQTRPVHVYMPIARHPQVISFDAHMDALLRQKTVVKDAVMASGVVSSNELMESMGLTS